MTGGIVRCCALALALGLAAAAAHAARVVDPASARRAIAAPAVIARDGELAALADDGRTTQLALRLERIAHDATLDLVAQEWLLDRGLHRIARLAPTAEARAALTRIAARGPAVYARIDPDHGDRATPLYDAGATARFALREWERAAARAAAQSQLAAGGTQAVARHAAHARAGAGDPSAAGIADAFRAAPPAQLAMQRAAVVDALARDERVDALALILAGRLADAELFSLVVDRADEPVALAAIPVAARSLDLTAALGTLAQASRRAGIASAAVLAIGELARSDAGARQFLFDALGDPGVAPFAAAALGRLSDPAVSAELGRRLAGARSEPERRLLVLALKLDATPAARAELARFAQSDAASPKLRREARR
jgi:hypothetical protein